MASPRSTHISRRRFLATAASGTAVAACLTTACGGPGAFRNISYDPTRAFYQEFNQLFSRHLGREIEVEQSHGGSGKQARAVLEGLEADVVTLALAYDIDALARIGNMLPAGWQSRLPNNSCPYTSTIVFLTRQGNPKNIRDWDDVIRPGVQVITPNPKTSGGARWNYLAAWGYAQKTSRKPETFVEALFHNAPVLDSGARGATTTFVQRKLGDVLICWENEAHLARREFKTEQLELVVPSISIKAEPPVAVVDANVDRRGTRALAEAYLKLLYSNEAQALAKKHYFRPIDHKAAEDLVTTADIGASWSEIHNTHFRDNGTFDRIYKP